jgi:hypothetical protein
MQREGEPVVTKAGKRRRRTETYEKGTKLPPPHHLDLPAFPSNMLVREFNTEVREDTSRPICRYDAMVTMAPRRTDSNPARNLWPSSSVSGISRTSI